MPHDFKTLANPFIFSELDVRTATDQNNEVWFCAKDVCEALGIVWIGAQSNLENMPEKKPKSLSTGYAKSSFQKYARQVSSAP